MNCIGSVCSGLISSSKLNSAMPSEPEVDGVESDECVRQQPCLLSQHDCSIVIKPPTIRDANVNIKSRSLKTSCPTGMCRDGGSRQVQTHKGLKRLQRVYVCVCRCVWGEDLVVLGSLSADEMYSANLFSIRTTLIQARPCREALPRL